MFMCNKSYFDIHTYNKFQCIESSHGCSLNQFLIMHSLFPQWKFKIDYDHIILRLPFVVDTCWIRVWFNRMVSQELKVNSLKCLQD